MPIKFRQPFFLADIIKKIRDFTVKGFSLVELLIVVAIVAVLAVMFIPNIFSAKVSARDSTRTSDLNQFKAGLKMYSMINRGYPTTTDWISIEADADSNGPFSQALNNPNFLSVIPRDPSYTSGGEYSYKYIATTTDKYTLCAKTEGKDGYVCIDQDNNSVSTQIAYVPGLGGTPPATIIPTIVLNGAAIASPYTESDANTRFSSGLQFDVTNTVSATVNGASGSLVGGVLTAVDNAAAKTVGDHSYNVIVTSSDGHTAQTTVTYHVDASAFACGDTMTFGGLAYGTVTGPDGKCWMDRNLGATQAATSATDANSYGYYYQWGRPADGHHIPTSGAVDVNSSTDIPGHANFITELDDPYDWRVPQSPNAATLWAGANGGSNNVCPTGWHVPTSAEWTTVAGYFSPQTSAGAFNSTLKLPLAGYRNRANALLYNQDSYGIYWPGNPSGTYVSGLYFNSGVVGPTSGTPRTFGCSVRCVKDDTVTPVIPTIALNGVTIASPYTESSADVRFPSGLQFDVTNTVSATVNGGAPVSLAGGVLTAVSNADAKTAGDHSYNVVVTSSDGHTANTTVAYHVDADPAFACGDAISYAGQNYSTAQIGSQCWFTENLNVGTKVDGAQNQVWNNGVIEKYCFLGNGPNGGSLGVEYCDSYGGLYQWEEMMQAASYGGGNQQGICPTGWHIPTDEEYKTLEMQIGMSQVQADTTGWRGTTEGDILKMVGGCQGREPCGTSGFDLLMAGLRLPSGSFGNLGSTTYLRTATESGSTAWDRYFNGAIATVRRTVTDDKIYGGSVRCVKDDTAPAPVIPTISLNGAAIASPYTVSDANTRFSSGVQFTVTNTVSATVNGGAPVSLAGGALTAVSNADAKTAGDHSYNVIVTSSDGHTAQTTVTYHVDAPAFTCGSSTVDFTYNGSSVTYGTVLNTTTSKCWLDRNLGASQVATAFDDSAAYGDLFQWGRLADGHQVRTSGTTTTLATSSNPGHSNFINIGNSYYDWVSPRIDSLWQGVSSTNNPCPSGWRIPIEDELETERLSWTAGNNSAGAFASPLKLTAVGYRSHESAAVVLAGALGFYWSSTVSASDARILGFGSGYANMSPGYRSDGFSVRCIKD